MHSDILWDPLGQQHLVLCGSTGVAEQNQSAQQGAPHTSNDIPLLGKEISNSKNIFFYLVYEGTSHDNNAFTERHTLIVNFTAANINAWCSEEGLL